MNININGSKAENNAFKLVPKKISMRNVFALAQTSTTYYYVASPVADY